MTQSRMSMPVIPYPTHLWEDEKALTNFLVNITAQKAKIISFSWEIPPLDPLAFLAQILQPNQLHFFWENPQKSEAVIAYGMTKALMVNSPERFRQTQDFIDNCLTQTISAGDLHLRGSGPHFFCGFSFFSEIQPSFPFPTATVFLPQIQIYRQKNHCVLVANISLNPRHNLKSKLEEIKQKISFFKPLSHPPKNRNFKLTDSPRNFPQVVEKALKSIQENHLTKIVLANAVDVVASRPFNLIASLDNLRQYHPDCYIFSLSNGQGSYFLGASPERLITIENQKLITDALAGSAPRGKTPKDDQKLAKLLLQNEKERREHQAVKEFIEQRLIQLGLNPQSQPLKILKLANIQHLWTAINAELPAHLKPLEIVAQLHPTPAVAGVPTPIACQEIRRYEQFERGLYAAPLGWIDYQGNSKFIVGIRSALVKDNQARLYAGAGIVQGSNPEKEYAEIQLKLQSLLRALI